MVTNDRKTTQRRLQIDVNDLHEYYPHQELNKLGWMSGRINPADLLMKKILNTKKRFCKLMDEGDV